MSDKVYPLVAPSVTGRPAKVGSRGVSVSRRVYAEGMVAGVIGALTIAIWFLILDTLSGRPLYTPSVLGSVLFQSSQALRGPGGFSVSVEIALMYTWVHVLAFAIIGGAAARLLAFAEARPNFGFGVLLLFVVLEFGLIGAASVLTEPVFHALAWPAVLGGNFLAAATMGGYFWSRHPNLRVVP